MLKKSLIFTRGQINQIIQGGASVLSRKLSKLTRVLVKIFKMLLYLPFAAVVVILVRLLRPFVLIRFGRMENDRIGHFAYFTELYVCEREAGIQRKNSYDIFYTIKPVSNFQLKRMWQRILYISNMADFVSLVISLNGCFPGHKEHIVQFNYNNVGIYDLYNRIPQHLYFTPKEEYTGNAILRKLGVPEYSPFVCFHARDSMYLNTIYPSLKDWNYHSHRDSSIKNYIVAAEELASRGYFVFRMGAVVKEPLDTANPMIIDYATKYRSDFLDIYLSAKCQFFIGSQSGIDEVPRIFRRKVAYVNCIPLEFIFIWNPIFLFIPKKLLLKKENRFLTFGEIIDLGMGIFDRSEKYDEYGLEVVENSPTEISDMVIEVDERLKGTWKDSREDEELQRRFNHLLKKSKLYRNVATRIGAKFLRQNATLLE